MRTIAVRGEVEVETTVHETFDEAMAEALRDVPPGYIVEVHEE